MRLILILLFCVGLNASLLDFKYINEANQAYTNKDYNKSTILYNKINNDEARFNVANSLYKQKKYKKALEIYQDIDKSNLEFKKLFNIGNSYAQLNKIDEAISSYTKALKIKDDKDIKYNLELLKKLKKEEEKKKKQKEQNKKDKDKKKQNNKKKDSKSKDQQNQNKSKKNDKNSKKQEKEQKETKKGDKKDTKKEDGGTNQKIDKQKKVPISDIEEKKWKKTLDKRGVNTLMIPLEIKTRSKYNEKNNW